MMLNLLKTFYGIKPPYKSNRIFITFLWQTDFLPNKKAPTPQLVRLQNQCLYCAFRGSNPGHPD